MLKFHLPMQNPFIKRSQNDKVVALPVKNINLSVNYYKEYLGFQLIENNERRKINYALLRFYNLELILEQAISSEKEFQNDVVLNLNWNNNQLKQHYFELRQKVKVKRNYSSNKDGISLFSVVDCDGNILNFQTKQAEN
jgi:catechol 2,3-dioxygenase-like lactoylglutathione lyase family enzyme